MTGIWERQKEACKQEIFKDQTGKMDGLFRDKQASIFKKGATSLFFHNIRFKMIHDEIEQSFVFDLDIILKNELKGFGFVTCSDHFKEMIQGHHAEDVIFEKIKISAKEV